MEKETEDVVVCSFCSSSFSRKTHLARHIRAHLNERKFKCTHCGLGSFTRSDVLARHLKKCKENPAGVPMSRKKACRICIARKVKCDLKNPCGRCAARGDECTYDIHFAHDQGNPNPSSSGRGHRSSASTLARTHEQIEGIEGEDDLATNVQQELLDLVASTSTPNDIFQGNYSVSDVDIFNGADLASGYMTSATPHETTLTRSHTGSEVEAFSVGLDLCHGTGVGNYVEQASAVHMLSTSMGVGQNSVSSVNPILQPSPHPTSHPFGTSSSDAFVDIAEVQEREVFLKLFMRHHVPSNPMFHLHTWNPTYASDLLQTTIVACGAVHSNSPNAESYIKRALRGELRQQIFRRFTGLPSHDVENQLDLLLAMKSLESLGLWHENPVERGIAAGYHGMLVLMVRLSSLTKYVSNWCPPNVQELNHYDTWKSWTRFETAKRLLLHIFMTDCLMPVFFNLPPTLQHHEIEILLPCSSALWQARTPEEWATQATKHDLRGQALASVWECLLDPNGVIPPVNEYSRFAIIHALIRGIYQAAGPNGGPQRTLMHGVLTRWYSHHVEGSRSLAKFASPDLTFVTLPYYWLSQVMHQGMDRKDLQRQGDQYYELFSQWLRGFLSTLEQ